MTALNRKLLRDLRRLWTQALAVALVMAAGVATLLIGVGAYTSLSETRAAYYDRTQFADLFTSAVRAPRALVHEISRLDGVAQAEARIVKLALIERQGFPLPITGQFISLPRNGNSILNQLHLRTGRLPDPARPDEAVVNESFARAHDLVVGSTISAILNGTRRELKVTGIGLSAEFIYALGPGDLMPDDSRFAIVWMGEPALEAAFNLKGAFNSLSLRLLRGANAQKIMDEMDDRLARYGGEGSYTREDQLSHAFLDAELKQLSTISRILPPAFLIVTAVLINMVLSRLVSLEREQIGLLRALGYSSFEISTHYARLVTLIALGGIAIGFAGGTWLSRGLTTLYAEFFHFPFQLYMIPAGLYAIAAIVALTAALLGGARAIFSAAALSPAVAMQPPSPPSYGKLGGGDVILSRYVSQLTVMVVRHMLRWPLRTAFTSLGIAFSIALLVSSLFSTGAINFMTDITFDKIDRQDASIAFGDVKTEEALRNAKRLPGVLAAEPYRAATANLANGHYTKRVSIIGKPPHMDISRVLDINLNQVELPPFGLVLSETLAKRLHVNRGETVHAEFLGDYRTKVDIPVVAIVQSYIGLMAFMDIDSLNGILGEGPRVNGVHVLLDSNYRDAFFVKAKEQPTLSAMALQRISLQKFRETIARNINIQIFVYASLASIIAFGVAYNSARIQFAERARELACLRVLGFTQYEVSLVLLLEFAFMTALAVPLGWLAGYGLAFLMTKSFESDLYRLPLIVPKSVYAESAMIVMLAVAVSALIVRHRVNRLDLIRVLKSRD
jgi:putative ABC transport system permease protein